MVTWIGQVPALLRVRRCRLRGTLADQVRAAFVLAAGVASVACGRLGFDATVGDSDGDAGDPDASTGFPGVATEAWTWIDVPGMICGNGSPTGIAVNLTRRSRRVVLIFETGGACWEAAPCYGILIPATAPHIDGFDATTFETVRPALDANWALQRDDAASTFGDASWVFVPYCTGDFFIGTQVATYDVLGELRELHHEGATNVDAMLARISMLDATEVFAVGLGGGGYGVQLNFDRIAATFPAATTHVLADGAPLVAVESGRWGSLMTRWQPRFPAGCTDCATNLSAAASFLSSALPSPQSRHALIAPLRDQAIALHWGYDETTLSTVTQNLGATMTGPQAAFLYDSTLAGLLDMPNAMTSGGVTVRAFVDGWASGDARFSTVGP